MSIATGSGGAPKASSFIVAVAEPQLPGAQVLALLATGVVKVTTTTGLLSVATGNDLPLFAASGVSHSAGAVPDPGAGAGATHFLREDAAWAVPATDLSAAVILTPASNTRNIIVPTADATTGILEVTNHAGTTTIFNVDTTNARVGIGTAAPAAVLHVVTPGLQGEIRLSGNRPTLAWYDTAGSLAGSIDTLTDVIGASRGLEIRTPDVTGATGFADNFNIMRFNGSQNKLSFGDNGATTFLQAGHKLFINAGLGSSADVGVGGQIALIAAISKNIGNVGINQANPTASLDLVGTDVAAGTYALKIKNTSAELITAAADRNFSGPNNWTGANWAIVSSAFQHTAGSTADAVLANANLTTSSIVSGDIYKVAFTITGRTVGTVTPKLGTAAGTAVGIVTAYTQYILANGNNSNLIFSPTTDFDGSIGTISVTRLQNMLTLTNSALLTLVDGANVAFGTTTGTILAATASQKMALWGKTPNVQPTTAIVGSAFVAGSGTAVNDASTFGGYTLKQIAAALIQVGALA